MRNKGFTLIELLAVIVIAGIFAIVTVVNINKFIGSSKDQINETDKSSIISATKNWAIDNLNSLPAKDSENQIHVDVNTLIDNGYLSDIASKYENLSVTIRYENNSYIYEITT